MLKPIDTRPTRITPRKEYESIKKYLRELSNPEFNTLTPEKEVELFRKVKEWDQKAKEKFIKANLRFVISVAKQYSRSWLNLEDLISEGNIWLLKAVDKFDETRWFRFISYAVWYIRESILQYIASNTTIKIPRNQKGRIWEIQNYKHDMMQVEGRIPTKDEIMDKFRLSEKQYNNYLDAVLSVRPKSLDEKVSIDDEEIFGNIIQSDNFKSPDFDLQVDSQKELILKALEKSLNPTEYEIITSYFWIWKEKPMTCNEIGYELKLSHKMVWLVKDRVCAKLAKILYGTELHELYNTLNS